MTEYNSRFVDEDDSYLGVLNPDGEEFLPPNKIEKESEMGISLIVGDNETRLGSASSIDGILDEISKLGDYPSFLNRSLSEGELIPDYKGKPTMFESNLEDMIKECDSILEKNVSQPVREVVKIISLVCKKAKENNETVEFSG